MSKAINANGVQIKSGTLVRNTIARVMRRGHEVFVKRRTFFGGILAQIANGYFFLSGFPIRFCASLNAWRKRESNAFRRLNRGFRIFFASEDEMQIDRLPGQSLWHHLTHGTLTPAMLRAAAREFRRAHSQWSDEYQGLWSHGDACMSNVIYDESTDRARLIDFEIAHVQTLCADERHADDLLVFLLDLVGFVPDCRWVPLAMTFLNEYGQRSVMECLRTKLNPPRGLGWFWWKVRTNFKPSRKIRARLDQLSQALDSSAKAVNPALPAWQTTGVPQQIAR